MTGRTRRGCDEDPDLRDWLAGEWRRQQRRRRLRLVVECSALAAVLGYFLGLWPA